MKGENSRKNLTKFCCNQGRSSCNSRPQPSYRPCAQGDRRLRMRRLSNLLKQDEALHAALMEESRIRAQTAKIRLQIAELELERVQQQDLRGEPLCDAVDAPSWPLVPRFRQSRAAPASDNCRVGGIGSPTYDSLTIPRSHLRYHVGTLESK
ncbi:unnamed protein product [Nesidiocoris tenuis]|uniref:Uncharacterized protein n=1 Tax=Nesidiocoris tenuis TaxID=355587 RepID=A0A6H5GT21_9HEMI|nr:unnamed protein product [Nesidiocoris tenuis]